MGDSILDFLSSNWASILGQPGPAGAGPSGAPGQGYGGGAAPPPLPPAAAMNNSGPFSPSGAVDGGALTPEQVAGPDLAPLVGTNPLPGPQGPGGSYGGGPNPMPPAPPPGGGGPSLVTPANAAIPTPTGPTPPAGPPNGAGYNRGVTDVGPGAPLNITPNFGLSGANPPTLPPPGGGPATNPGSLMRALGLLREQQQRPNYLQSALAGIGHGLSAVGAQRPGTTGAASFAAGMGGGLTGGIADQEFQKKRMFDQSSTALRDMVLAKNSDNAESYNQARAAYFNSRATQAMTGGTGSGAWQNTPYGRVMAAEKDALQYQKELRVMMLGQWSKNETTPETQAKDIANMKKEVDDYRQGLYKAAGVNPKEAENILTRGTTPDNAFDTKGMTMAQFNSQVLLGHYYKDENGNVRKRTQAPPDQAQPQPLNPQQTAVDDYLAREPAAEATGGLM